MTPQTSLAANVASKPHRDKNHTKILQALEKLPNNEGIADAIAAYCTLDKVEVSRRLSELEGQGKIFNTGRKGLTQKACKASIYKLIKEPQPQLQTKLFN